jgi:fermentation-respiration switch protein FrsA (DUF1100 family)
MRAALVVRRVLIGALALVIAITAGIFAFVWWGQERITYQPPRTAEPVPAGAERAEYRAADGQPLYALVVGASSAAPPARVLLAFHGNADMAPWLVPWAGEIARRTGYIIVLPEYRGYNGLPGAPHAEGIRLDARAALEFVRARFGAAARIAYYGHSLGTAVAAELAAESPPSVLILEAPFTAAADMAALFGTPVARIAWRMLGRIPYDTRARVQAMDVPVWVAHGDSDRLIPVRMGRTVFGAARHPGELLIVPGGAHNGLAESGGAAYWDWIGRALR